MALIPRFGDILSYCYLVTSTLREFEKNPKEDDRPMVDYICNYCFNQIQIAREDILFNLPMLKVFVPFIKLNPIGLKAKDSLNREIVNNLSKIDYLQELTSSIFISKDKKDRLNIFAQAIKQNEKTKKSFAKIKDAVKQKNIQKDVLLNMIEEAFSKGLISKDEKSELKKAYKLKQEVVSVDAFKVKKYKSLR